MGNNQKFNSILFIFGIYQDNNHMKIFIKIIFYINLIYIILY